VSVRGSRLPPRALLDDELDSLRGRYVSLVADPDPAAELLGTNVGLRPGPGGAYVGTRKAPSGLQVQDSIAVMAAGDGRVSVVGSVSTSTPSPGERAFLYKRADAVLKSVAWASDLARPGGGALLHGSNP
jgi:hypothetical protein